jgi:N-methylhydantoinase A/oxoprolinase/acetone carboxylase beta subunit
MTSSEAKTQPPESFVLGIDTGGTYTDAVLLESHSRRVVAAHKSLTTKRDLSIGIEAVIDGISIANPSTIKLVSISTTLATNAIAEGKGKRVGLLLAGYDPDLITTFKLESHFVTPDYFYFSGGHDLFGEEKEPLDLAAIQAKVNELKDTVDALAFSSYFSPLNPEHERQALYAISEVCDLPVVLGHHLSTKLGSVERATTAALNASLLAVLHDFVIAVQAALRRRGIDAPLMVVRGDGTLMRDEFAADTPVETIHSGPAASAIGGRFLSDLDDALVIDVGGTTTDMALVQGGQVTVIDEGATVGGYKTSVKAAHLHTIALGGDSHITPNGDNGIDLGPERVTPLAYLAWKYPQVLTQLKSLARQSHPHSISQLSATGLEFWFLLREPRQPGLIRTKQTAALVDLLRQGPQALSQILERLDLFHVMQLEATHLIRQEIIGKAGLTPTDLLHVDGRYTTWNVEAAKLGLDAFCRMQGWDMAEIFRQAWGQMTVRIVYAVLTFLTGKKLPALSFPDEDMGRWFFNNSLCPPDAHPHLETQVRLHQPIIGIGAPAGIFLKDVADVLHTDLILPKHHEVANAVGAVAGTVMVAEEVLVYPQLSSKGLDVIGYYVQNSDGRRAFQAREDALTHAHKLSREGAAAAALRAGATQPQVTIEEVIDGLDTYRIRAKAIGNPRLAG